LGEFSPVGRLFTLAFFKTKYVCTEEAQFLDYLPIHIHGHFDKTNLLGHYLGDLFATALIFKCSANLE
jgi:hypothetical protein